MTRRPTGTVTFLFTDVEGSTSLWHEHPDAMKDSLATHRRLDWPSSSLSKPRLMLPARVSSQTASRTHGRKAPT